MAIRRSHFKVFGRFDGSSEATVTITTDGARALISVRPKRRRRVFELDLADVARGIVYDVVKKEKGIKIAKRRG